MQDHVDLGVLQSELPSQPVLVGRTDCAAAKVQPASVLREQLGDLARFEQTRVASPFPVHRTNGRQVTDDADRQRGLFGDRHIERAEVVRLEHRRAAPHEAMRDRVVHIGARVESRDGVWLHHEVDPDRVQAAR